MLKIQILLVLGICSWVSAWDYQSLGLSWADSSHADYDATCAGSRQSPINIIRSEATVVGQDDLPRLRKTCSLVEGKFTNNGHTLKFELTDGKAVFSEKEYLSGGPYGSVKYFFLQFHLHWGSTDCEGSEHTVDSNRFPAELHMVHVKEDHVSQDGTVDLDAALAAEDGLAVLGIFVTGGADSATWFDVIANATKDIADSDDQSTETVLATVNLNQIVQRINPTFSGDFNYWYYNGSLTTPGCQEVVHWVVAEKALQVTDDQLAELYRLTDDNSAPLLNNFRLSQPISAGDVYYVDINEETESVYQSDCTCNLRGTDGFDCTCNSETSQCNCDSSNGYSGTDCDSCLSGWYWTDSSSTCTDCSCNLSGTISGDSTCVDETGQCDCDSDNGYSGIKCDECAFGYEFLSGSRTCSGIPQLIGIGGLETDTFLGKITEAVDYNDQQVCTIDSFFDATAREGLDDGVYRGMVCDHVHGKTICCGGDFGTNGNRRHCQRDCLSLEGASWDNSTIEALPVGLTYPSSTPFNDGTNDLWLVTGGENSLQEGQTAMYTLASDLTWTKLEHDLPEAMVAHCSVQISQGVVAFIGGVPTASDLFANSKVEQIHVFDINAGSGSEWSQPATLPTEVTRGAIMGCYKVPNENKVIFGCSYGPNEMTYEWNLDDDAITQKTECRNQRGVKFHVMPDGSIIGSGHGRNIWTFDSTSGFDRSATPEQYTTSHNPPMSVVSPFKTGTCST